MNAHHDRNEPVALRILGARARYISRERCGRQLSDHGTVEGGTTKGIKNKTEQFKSKVGCHQWPCWLLGSFISSSEIRQSISPKCTCRRRPVQQFHRWAIIPSPLPLCQRAARGGWTERSVRVFGELNHEQSSRRRRRTGFACTSSISSRQQSRRDEKSNGVLVLRSTTGSGLIRASCVSRRRKCTDTIAWTGTASTIVSSNMLHYQQQHR